MNKLLAASFILILAAVPPAWAEQHHGQGGGHGRGGGHGEGGGGSGEGHGKGHGDAERGGRGPEGGRREWISGDQRTIVRDYYRQEYIARGFCPPGLAKKGTGCLPPGQAKKRYWVVGQLLPPAVVLQPLPPELVVRLGVPPVGYGWGYVDGRILLYALGNRLVVDIVDSLF